MHICIVTVNSLWTSEWCIFCVRVCVHECMCACVCVCACVYALCIGTYACNIVSVCVYVRICNNVYTDT